MWNGVLHCYGDCYGDHRRFINRGNIFFCKIFKATVWSNKKTLSQKGDLFDGFVKLERTSQVSYNGMEKILSFYKKHVCYQNPPCLMLFISYCFTHGTLNSHEQSYLSYTVPLCFKAKSENWKYFCQMLPFSHFLCLVSSGMHGSYNPGFHGVLIYIVSCYISVAVDTVIL